MGYPTAVPSPTVLATGFHAPETLPSRRPRVNKRASSEAVPTGQLLQRKGPSPRAKILAAISSSGETGGVGKNKPAQLPPAPARLRRPTAPGGKDVTKTQMPKATPTGDGPSGEPTDTPPRLHASGAPSRTISPSSPVIPSQPTAIQAYPSSEATSVDLNRLQHRLEAKLSLLCSPKQQEYVESSQPQPMTTPAMTPAASHSGSQGRLSRSNSVFSISLYDYSSDEGERPQRSRSRTSTTSSDGGASDASLAGRMKRSARVKHNTGSAYMSRRESRQSVASVAIVEEEDAEEETPRLAQASRLSMDVEQAISQLRLSMGGSPDLEGYFSPESEYSDNGAEDSQSSMSPAEWIASLKRRSEIDGRNGGDRRGRIWTKAGHILPLSNLPTPGAEKGFDFGQ